MAQKAYVNVQGSWREVSKVYVNVAGTWRVLNKAYTSVGGVDRVWWPNTGGGVPPLAPGNYEPALVSGGGDSGGRFDLSPYIGSNITAVHAKISYATIIGGTSTPVNVSGQTTGTFYRTITITDEWSSRTIYHDLGATAVSQFNANSADGYSVVNSGIFWITRTRLRITIA